MGKGWRLCSIDELFAKGGTGTANGACCGTGSEECQYDTLYTWVSDSSRKIESIKAGLAKKLQNRKAAATLAAKKAKGNRQSKKAKDTYPPGYIPQDPNASNPRRAAEHYEDGGKEAEVKAKEKEAEKPPVQKGSTVSSGKSTFAKSSGTTKSGSASRSAQRTTSGPAGRAKVVAADDDVRSPRTIDATSLLELEDSADPDLDAKKAEQEAAANKAADDAKKKKDSGSSTKKKGPKVTLNPKDNEVDHIKKGVGDDVRKIKGKTSEQGDFVPGTRLATRRRRRR